MTLFDRVREHGEICSRPRSSPFWPFPIGFHQAAKTLVSVAACWAIIHEAALADPVQSMSKPIKLVGMKYEKARSTILSAGWKPWAGECDALPTTCKRYPEVDACTLVFPTLCGMHFVKGRECLLVGTRGESPPGELEDPRVTNITVRRAGANLPACPSPGLASGQ